MRPIRGSAGKALVYVVLHAALHLRPLSMMVIPSTFLILKLPPSLPLCVSPSLCVYYYRQHQPRQISNFARAT